MKNTKKIQHSLLQVAVLTALGTMYGSAFAQVTTTELPSVTVTGYGVTQKLEDTSGSVEVVTDEQLEASNTTELKDLNGKVSGLAFKESMTSGAQRLYIRGQGDMQDMEGGRVGVTLDGVPLRQAELQNPDLVDVERIEVLKGSQVVLYGAGTSAGVVNIITKKPTESGGAVSLGFGNNKRREGSFKYDYVVNDALYLGLDASFVKDDGFVDNKYTGGTLADQDRRNLALKATITPSDNTVIDIRAFANNSEVGGPFMAYVDKDSLKPLTGNGGSKLPFWTVTQTEDSYTDSQTRGANVRISHDFGGMTLTSTTGYTHYKADSFTDGDGGMDRTSESYENFKSTQLFQEFRLNGETDHWNWLLGASGSSDKTDRHQRAISTYQGTVTTSITPREGKTTALGLFGQVTYNPIDQLDVTGGLRVERNKAELEAFSAFAGLNGYEKKGSQSETNYAWSGQVTWHFSEKAHAYATVSRAYKPGGYFGFYGVNQYDRETSLSEEIGFKGKFLNDRLFTSVAVFNTRTKDYQSVNQLLTTDVIIDNLGKVDIRGFELAADYVLNDYVAGGLTFTKLFTEIKEHKDAQYVGKDVPWVSDYTLNAHVTFTLPTEIGKFRWRTDYSLNGDFYANYENDTKQDSYGVLDTSVTWEHKGHQLRLWAKNLLDEEYYTYLYFNTAWNYSVGSYGASRSYGLTYKYKF